MIDLKFLFNIFFVCRVEKQDVTIKDCILARKQVGRLFFANLLHDL